MKVIKSRLEDVEVGDVVNRQPDAESGWFTVAGITTLFNGHLQLADESEQLTVSGDHKDMVGLQLVEHVLLDANGMVAPPVPPMMAVAPAPVADPEPPAPTADAAPAVSPAAPSSEPATAEPAHDQNDQSDLAAEVAAAAEVATNMAAPAGGGPHVPPGVNLALVAELLEDLDVGDAPTITSDTTPLGSPAPTTSAPVPAAATPAPVVPEGARPVYGDELPETPSYKNPVVVPEGTLLPRRSRAA